MADLTSDSPTVSSALADVAGLLAGRYQVRARLGRGATKEVYLAYDTRLDREVALAVVVGAAGSDAIRARLEREAQVTGRLGDHPNVITVYDSGEHEGVPYLVLRAMPGGSLADMLKRGRIDAARTVALGHQVALALAHAHAHGVVHRDVKPDNVWLAADGTAALGDFGIARQGGSEHLTAEGVVLGTVRYLSPEQILGGEAVPASDLYALGITLYELATGDPPFTAADPAQVLRQHVSARPVAPSQHEPAVAPALERLILELLAKQPKQRPASATEVADALASMEAKQVPAGRLTGRDARRGPAWADPRRRQSTCRATSRSER
jgi:serine/threonine protein kinase